jgi:hypothetical protein
MFGELIYLHLSKMGTNSSKAKVFASTPWGPNNSFPRRPLVGSITIIEFVALGVGTKGEIMHFLACKGVLKGSYYFL